MKPRALVLKTAGTNCDLETCQGWEMAGADWELLHVNEFISGDRYISNFELISLPGGFSYGDDISAAKVYATKILAYLINDFNAAVERGVPILGICNGFQVLIKTGLLPGGETGLATLFVNDSNKFEDRWVYLQPEKTKCVFTDGLTEPVYIPVAHKEGKFVLEQDTYEKLESSGQVVFRYCNANGSKAGGKYPVNPNGSMGDIAGITDSTGLILGMMPHPERHLVGSSHPAWTRKGLAPEGEGLAIFRNAVAFVKGNSG